MKHILFFYFLIAGMLNIISLSIIYNIYAKSKDKVLKVYIILSASYIFFFFAVVGLLYARINIVSPDIKFRLIFIFTRYIATHAMFLIFLWFAKSVLTHVSKHLIRTTLTLFLFIAGVFLAMLLCPLSLEIKASAIRIGGIFYRYVVAVFLLVILFGKKNCILKIKDNRIRKLIRNFCIYFVCFSIFYALFEVLKITNLIKNSPPSDLIIMPTSLIFWNIMNFIFIRSNNKTLGMLGSSDIPYFLIDKYRITSREKEVIHLIGEGFSNKEIAEKLGISVNTVKVYIYAIFQKTNVSNRIELLKLLHPKN